MADGGANVIRARVGYPGVADWLTLARDLRPDERQQWEVLTGLVYDPELAAQGYIAAPGLKYVLRVDGLPQVAACFEPIRQGVLDAWAIGTPEAWGSHWRAITLQGRRLVDRLLQTQAQRIQIVSLASRTAAHEWYERGLGFECEGTLRRYFPDGSDAVMHAKVAP